MMDGKVKMSFISSVMDASMNPEYSLSKDDQDDVQMRALNDSLDHVDVLSEEFAEKPVGLNITSNFHHQTIHNQTL